MICQTTARYGRRTTMISNEQAAAEQSVHKIDQTVCSHCPPRIEPC
jgi:hypothetical protein